MDELHLEDAPQEGKRWTVLIEVVVFDEHQRCHKLKTALKGVSVVYHGELPIDTTILLLVNAVVRQDQGTWIATPDDDTAVLPRPAMTVKGLRKVVELCSGMGCLGTGMEHAGFSILLRNDWNPHMLKLARQVSDAPTLLGNLNDDKVLAKACLMAPDAGVLTSGISCQPYSRLGDGRAQADSRSATLPGTLRFGFLARFAVIILECVAEAKECTWVQHLLSQFATITGYHVSQGDLRLQAVWPARRHRWWCILSHPAVGKIPWHPFPQVQPMPLVAHVLDSFKTCNEFELNNLMLDLYELGRFAAAGFDTNEIQWNGQMATALHSCGNQLGSCPCGCRSHPFTESRLAKGGLHGLLVRLAGHAKCGVSLYPCYRHVHPDELALLNGMFPGISWDEPKMALCALGQLASPLQSAWIGAHVLQHVDKTFSTSCPINPEHVLLDLMQKLLKQRDQVFGEPTKPSTKLFQSMVANMQFVMPSLAEVQSKELRFPSLLAPNPGVPCATPQEFRNSHDTTQAPADPLALPESAVSEAEQLAQSAEQSVSATAVMVLEPTAPDASDKADRPHVHQTSDPFVPGDEVSCLLRPQPIHQIDSTTMPTAGQLDGLCPPTQTPGMLATPGHPNASDVQDDTRETPQLTHHATVTHVHAATMVTTDVIARKIDGQWGTVDHVTVPAADSSSAVAADSGLGSLSIQGAGQLDGSRPPTLTPGMLATPGLHNASEIPAVPSVASPNVKQPHDITQARVDHFHAITRSEATDEKPVAMPTEQLVPTTTAAVPPSAALDASDMANRPHVHRPSDPLVPGDDVSCPSRLQLTPQVRIPPMPLAGQLDGFCPPIKTPGMLATPGHINASDDHAAMSSPQHESASHPHALSMRSVAVSESMHTVPAECFVPADAHALKQTSPCEGMVPIPAATEDNLTAMTPHQSFGSISVPRAGQLDGPHPPTKTPGMLATPGNLNASEMPVAQFHSDALHAGPVILTQEVLTTPGIVATPGDKNATDTAMAMDLHLHSSHHAARCKRSVMTPCDVKGGVMGFENHKRQRLCTESSATSENKCITKQTLGYPAPEAMNRDAVATDGHHTQGAMNTDQELPLRSKSTLDTHTMSESHTTEITKVWVLHPEACLPLHLPVSKGQTPADIQRAEDALSATNAPTLPRTWVNTHMDPREPLQRDQVIQLSKMVTDSSCPFKDAENCPPNLRFPCTRREALWRQQAWVADDELSFYLGVIEKQGLADTMPIAHFCHEGAASEEAADWLHDMVYYLEDHQKCITACCIGSHWIPVMLTRDANDIKLHTTPEGSPLIPAAQKLVNWHDMTLRVAQQPLPQVFAADCGFQSFAWLFGMALDEAVEGFTPDKAAGWRTCLAAHLLEHDQHEQMIHRLVLGGVQDAQLHDQIAALLREHGVWPDRASDRAHQVITKINHHTLKAIVTSKKPWPELKAAANHVNPILKLVMPDELQSQIDARAGQRQKYGKKPAQKPRSAVQKGFDTPTVTASDLQIPHGVFAQQDGQVLGPIRPLDVGPSSRGIILVDQVDSFTLRKMPTPVSQQGLALLVLATKDNAGNHESDPIRFPAMCVKTQEPLIVSGYLYQLGAMSVQRHEPPEKLAVDQIQTEAVRCLVFRDQSGPLWDAMSKQPVKAVFSQEPILQGTTEQRSPAIDVWDRQWMTKKFERAKPANADLFAFTFRMAADRYDELLAASSNNGIYYEPRSQCGRKPNDAYHVTWLPNMSFQEAKYAQQTAPHPTSMTRHGDRYGLRSDALHAQPVHDKFRPETPLLLGSKETYLVGPLPFSTTKDGVAKMLKAWQWDARPLQPKGRTPDSNGVQWTIQAVEDPEFWIYTLQHGDVLITKQQPTKSAPPSGQYAVIASRKTLEHLGTQDPWLQHDPWQKPTAAAPVSSPLPIAQPSLSNAQLATLEANLEKKIMTSLQAKMPDGDATMEPSQIDHRVSHLEHQLSQVQASQQGLEAKVGQLHTQIEHQGKVFGHALDQKLAEQMDKIESLLTKRSRHE